MEVRDFSKVFDGISRYLPEDKSFLLENRFHRDGQYTWNRSFRDVRRFSDFVTEFTELDLGLEEGEVVKFLSSLGCRMIIIGTFAGNVAIHQRTGFEGTGQIDRPEDAPVIVVCYAPKVIESIIGTKPLRQADLYRFTGFFNPKDNLGLTLKQIRELSVAEVS